MSTYFFYLYYMLIEIHNRLPIGPAVGFSIYNPDEDNDEYLVILYLIFIEIRFAWWRKKPDSWLRLRTVS